MPFQEIRGIFLTGHDGGHPATIPTLIITGFHLADCEQTVAKKTLTADQGVPVADNQDSLTAGQRGPVLMQDVHLIGKLAHFDRV